MNRVMRRFGLRGPKLAAAAGAAAACLFGAVRADDNGAALHLHSSTFSDGGALPLITIANIPGMNGQNSCTPDGSPGGDQSPQLSWTHVPRETRSFAVVAYDVTASFTHWGIYNMAPETTTLPLGAGAAGSPYGAQVSNDFGDLSYDGPCPPTTLTPHIHRYVFTVYALDVRLPALEAQGDFPPGAEALYHALLSAGRDGHILASAGITGLYSAVPSTGN
jgi:Raf kinase inhibitor-like YbhB/YbcL family protein